MHFLATGELHRFFASLRMTLMIECRENHVFSNHIT